MGTFSVLALNIPQYLRSFHFLAEFLFPRHSTLFRIIFNTLFGLSTSFWFAISVRFLLGCVNCLLGVIRVNVLVEAVKEYLLSLFQMSIKVAFTKGVSLLFQAYASEVVSEEYHALSLSVVRLLSILFILLLVILTSSSLLVEIFPVFFLAYISGKYIERYRTDSRPCYWRLSCSGSLHPKLCL